MKKFIIFFLTITATSVWAHNANEVCYTKKQFMKDVSKVMKSAEYRNEYGKDEYEGRTLGEDATSTRIVRGTDAFDIFLFGKGYSGNIHIDDNTLAEQEMNWVADIDCEKKIIKQFTDHFFSSDAKYTIKPFYVSSHVRYKPSEGEGVYSICYMDLDKIKSMYKSDDCLATLSN